MDEVKYELIEDCKVAVFNSTLENFEISKKIAAFNNLKVII